MTYKEQHTQSLALEAIQHHNRVNAVCPGYVVTAMRKAAIMAVAQRNDLSY
ncbi:hypothetical protein [Metabacillus sediminilitoris]|uniref:hypothetical protein n=1 Tax=Metabacillus sediminilitoris TaxID=2567941 RepID=UPI0012D76FC7|nr:hypothetical protein [Metabacillus sediminilitoris]QGQ45555.1 hypothetical protein GMB29_10030 [Metabacillus sediminilitoris]